MANLCLGEQVSKTKNILLCVLGGATPFALMSTYLFFTRTKAGSFSTRSDYVAFAVSLIVGLLLIGLTKFQTRWKFLIFIVFAGLVPPMLFGYTFAFLCAAYQDCL